MGYLDDDFLRESQNEYLKASFASQFIAGLTFGYAYNNQTRNLGATPRSYASIWRRRAT